MLKKLKEMLTFAPTVEYVDFEDGLLAVRSSKALKTNNTVIKLKASYGTVVAHVLVESYDQTNGLYRLKLFEHDVILDSLEIERREGPRLPKVVRVSSQAFPGYSGTTEDISVTGTRINTSGPLELSHDIEIKMELDDPDIPPIRLFADVAWTAVKYDGSYHSGLRYSGLDRETGKVIQRYIEARLAIEKKLHTLEKVDWEPA